MTKPLWVVYQRAALDKPWFTTSQGVKRFYEAEEISQELQRYGFITVTAFVRGGDEISPTERWCVHYRTGGMVNFCWHRTNTHSSHRSALEQAAEIQRMGYTTALYMWTDGEPVPTGPEGHTPQ